MADGRLRKAAEAMHAASALFVDAVRVVHGSADVEAKYTWTLDAAKGLTGALDAAIVGWDNDQYVVLAGDGVFEELLDELDAVLRSALAEGHRVVKPALVAVPVPAAIGTHAVLLLSCDDHDSFDEIGIDSVTVIAANLGVALDNLAAATQLAEQDVERREVVHQLQEAVKPAIPTVPDTVLGVHYLAADPKEPTGGDLYDWHVLPDGDLYLAVIDIVGKGVGATKDAVALAHVLRVLVLQGSPLGKVVREADDLLRLHHPELAATIVVARYDPASGRVQVASGGHPPPLLVRADGTTEYLKLSGAPLGFPGAGSDDVATVFLDRSDSLIFYTDGVVEARKDIVAGLDELAEAAAVTGRYPARQQARVLVERALAGAARRDDSLVLVLRRRVPPSRRPAGFAPFEHVFTANPAAVGLARHLFADWLRFQDVSEDEAEDPLLIFSELAANAVSASAGGPCSARAWAETTSLVIEMESETGGSFTLPPPPPGDELPELDAESGRGLFVVRTLADSLDVTERGGATVVRCLLEGLFP